MTTQDSLAPAARELVASLLRQPWGQVSPSVYETGRLVALAPWLPGHAERITFLQHSQRTDGGWGGPGGYQLVPTLSATEALLATLRRTKSSGPVGAWPQALAGAAGRGLRALVGHSEQYRASIPDTPAIDLIVPALVRQINAHLNALRETAIPGTDHGSDWHAARQLHLPVGMDTTRLDAVHRLLATGAPVPAKLLHALEVLVDTPDGSRIRTVGSIAGIRPVPPGTVGGSPAATAAWLGGPHGDATALAYLERVARERGGPVPCATPIHPFERAWVVSGLAQAGVPLVAPPELARDLAAALGPDGAPGGPGLPEDADTTSMVLYALACLGRPASPASLWRYDTGTHFSTWPGEDGSSVTTNAHVLDAFGRHLRNTPASAAAAQVDHDVAARYRSAVRRLCGWLREQQQPDGYWQDRWHASAYYATACAASALSRFGTGPGAADAVALAVDWIVATQRADGSWGRWAGTAEETAYALQVLLTAGDGRAGVTAAAARGHVYLLDAAGQDDGPALWHDKDLYRPTAIVRAATLAALQLARTHPVARIADHPLPSLYGRSGSCA